MPDQATSLDPRGILDDAVIVAAHPDDEILWFSSIITKVKAVVVCYLRQDSRPDWSAGRRQAIGHYPLPHISCLDLKLSEVFDCSDWQYPRVTDYGLEIRRKGSRRKNYESNFFELNQRLRDLLGQYSHVFTHNPWGEYGHEEHVQVFRAVENLQAELKFTLWISNYISNRSVPLMLASTNRIGNQYFCAPTNKDIAAQIRDVYIKNGCWTWYPDFHWAEQDTFFQVNPAIRRKRNIGSMFPLNFIDVGESESGPRFHEKMNRLIRRMGRLGDKLFER
jgi:LmbE family N-acetylglucosaminyl deacetylase